MRYFSMFSGIGGFELGIQRAFSSTQRKGQPTSPSIRNTEGSGEQLPELGIQGLACVGYSEIDKYAIKVYERNFNGHRNYGDATAINPTDLPDFDLLVGGFPCQAFSIAGKRAGFNDTRGTLFFDIARILAEKRPRHLVLENVKGLLSHDSGRTFTTIIGVLTDMGYLVEWQVLNSKDFGVPQNRERVYIVGHLGNECGRQVFPITANGGSVTKLPGYYSNTLTRRYEGAQATGTYVANTISTGTTHTVGTYVGKSKFNAQEIAIRRLTPKECERLQGFPDDWTLLGGTSADEIMSDTQRYKMCGNAVTVNTVQAVMERLLNHEN